MSAKLILLGLLQESPMHGYEVKQRIEHEAMAEWAGVSYGAIYSALNKLARDGFVEKIGTEQVGKRPSRDVYRITESGRAEFLRLLRETLSTVAYQNDPVDIALRFAEALPAQEMRVLLEERKAMLEQGFQMLTEGKAGFAEGHQGTPYVEEGCLLFDHWLLRLEAELKWLQSVIARLEQGLLP
ncbi:MAG: PadR family transcriptional regulator [Anaerolineae bacterium]|nr:PadR family transcriptional regulator [Anaerolineae bacterium]